MWGKVQAINSELVFPLWLAKIFTNFKSIEIVLWCFNVCSSKTPTVNKFQLKTFEFVRRGTISFKLNSNSVSMHTFSADWKEFHCLQFFASENLFAIISNNFQFSFLLLLLFMFDWEKNPRNQIWGVALATLRALLSRFEYFAQLEALSSGIKRFSLFRRNFRQNLHKFPHRKQ